MLRVSLNSPRLGRRVFHWRRSGRFKESRNREKGTDLFFIDQDGDFEEGGILKQFNLLIDPDP